MSDRSDQFELEPEEFPASKSIWKCVPPCFFLAKYFDLMNPEDKEQAMTTMGCYGWLNDDGTEIDYDLLNKWTEAIEEDKKRIAKPKRRRKKNE